MPTDQPDDTPRPTQHIRAGKNAFTAGRDLYVLNLGRETESPRRAWGNVPARNLGFTGRAELLRSVRDMLVSGDRAAVQALHGIGGVGKTQIAIEYSHRYAAEYNIVWWIKAERPELIGEQFAVLASALRCAEPGAQLKAVRQALLNELHQRDQWLLIFDNVEKPEDIADWLPGGSGHVLITSRAPAWDELAVPVQVGVLDRSESVSILLRRVRGLAVDDADHIALAVGDLPLAVVQAATYMAQTGMAADEYVALLRDRSAELMGLGKPPSYDLPLAAVTQIAYDRLHKQDPQAAYLAAVCAFLAPDPIPAGWFTGLAPVAERAADSLAWREALSTLTQSALARIETDGVVMHRLTQAIIRSHLTAGTADAVRATAERMVVANHPGDEAVPLNWPRWARVVPHLLAVHTAGASSVSLKDLAINAVWYLARRGDPRAASELAGELHARWQSLLGPDDQYALRAENGLAEASRALGQYEDARRLDEDILARRRRVLGEDHPDTLVSASNLAADLCILGDFDTAQKWDDDTLTRRRQSLGEDHPDTLTSANNLAFSLRRLGKFRAARELDEDTFTRRRRVLGADHPETLISASNLAASLRKLEDFQAARELDGDTLTRRRRVLGADHPDTLRSATNLASDLRAQGNYQAARELDEDTLMRRRQTLGDEHPDTQQSARNLAEDIRSSVEPLLGVARCR